MLALMVACAGETVRVDPRGPYTGPRIDAAASDGGGARPVDAASGLDGGAWDASVAPDAEASGMVDAGFDAGPVTVDSGSSSCFPRTCASLGAECGTAPDGCGGTLSCGGCSAPADCSSNACRLPHDGTARMQLNYVVVPHPDDEIGGWALIENSPGNYNIFIHLTRGEGTGYCGGGFPGYQPGYGEAPPGDRADYATQTCRTLRMGSTVAFYRAMASIDPYIGPIATTEHARRGVALPVGTPGRSCAVTSDRYTIRVGQNAAIVFFDLGDGNLSRCEVEWAVSQVRALRGTDWLPALPEWSLVGASFYNDSYPNCVSYAHPDHRAVHEALWNTNFGTRGPQYGRTCRSDPDSGRVDYVDQYGMLDTSGSTRVGAAQVYYGWLRGDAPWPSGSHDDVAAWSQNQAFWIRH